MLPKRKKSHYPVPGRRESLWKKRGTTIQYLLYFAAGVLLGSIAAVLCGAESIPCRILVNQLRAIPEQGLWALWRERLLFMAILLLYLMIAARCLWGNLMIPVALVLYGIGQGIVVSFLLMLVGLGGIGYILLGILLPRTVQLVALILMCNLAHSRCEQMSGAEGNGQTAMWILSALLLAGGGLLESAAKWKMIAGILS
jgi:hypothetical protein